MNYTKQIEKSCYEFNRYMTKPRWCSLWHQIRELQELNPKRVLEIGTGPGLFKAIATHLGIEIETLDYDPDLQPDYVASATEIPLDDGTFDVVCAFQVLEHLPYEASLKAFGEMARVSSRFVLISLPDARRVWRYHINSHDFLIPRPRLTARVHKFEGEHYWEINKRGYSLARVIADLTKQTRLMRTYRVYEYPFHRFFVFEKTPSAS
jgi:SAM-dependent methyltransferase